MKVWYAELNFRDSWAPIFTSRTCVWYGIAKSTAGSYLGKTLIHPDLACRTGNNVHEKTAMTMTPFPWCPRTEKDKSEPSSVDLNRMRVRRTRNVILTKLYNDVHS